MPSPEQIYEKTKITTNAKLVSGSIIKTSYTGKLDLYYLKNGTAIFTDSEIEVKKGVVSKEYEVPFVAGTEESYELKVRAAYGKKKEKSKILGEYTVWPKEATVNVKELRTNADMKLAKFEVVQDGVAVEYCTDDTGKTTCPLKKAAYTVRTKAPLALVSDVQTPKRAHVVTVDPKQTAAFVTPVVTAAPYKPATEGGAATAGVRQFVNMTTASAGCDAKGSIVEFEVSNKVKADGLANDKIFIKVTFTRESKRNDPSPALLAPAQSIVMSNAGKTYTGFVKLTADGGTAKFKVELGLAGGDTATITCGYTESDPTDDKIILVNWRKLGYQLRYPELLESKLSDRTRDDGTTCKDIPDSIFNVYKARLAAVFIEYTNIKSHKYANPAADAPCFITKGFLETSNDATVLYVLDGLQNWTAGATAFDAITDSREIHITLCEKAYSSNGANVNPKHTLKAVDSDVAIYTPPQGEPNYVFLKKTHTAVDEINIKVAGFSWVAKMDDVSADAKNPKPTFSITDTPGDLAAKTFTIAEATCGGPAITVTLSATNTVTTPDQQKIKTYYEACFSDAKKLRQAANTLTFVVTGPPASTEADTCRSALNAAINNIHTTSTKKILYHPGVDDDGNPRTGPMSDVEIDHYSATKIKIKLPVRAQPTDAPLPGDFVGDPSATKCPVNIEFTVDGTSSINGNAGSGAQLMVLKTDAAAACASTVCHELGHSMGMTVMPSVSGHATPTPPGLAVPKNVDQTDGWYYRDKDSAPFNNGFRKLHKGGHCASGMPTNKKSDSKFSGWSPTVSQEGCIMWGSGGVADTRKKYCDVCTEVLKARRLEDVRSTWLARAQG